MALVGLLAGAGIAALAPLLPLLLGPDFAGVRRIAAGLGLACPFVALQYPPGDALTARGRQPLRTGVTFAGVARRGAAAGGRRRGRRARGARLRGSSPARPRSPALLWLALLRTAAMIVERPAPSLPALLCAGALLLAIAEFGQVWYYPPPEAGAELTRAFGGAFRLALWLAAAGCIGWHLLRRGLGPVLSGRSGRSCRSCSGASPSSASGRSTGWPGCAR